MPRSPSPSSSSKRRRYDDDHRYSSSRQDDHSRGSRSSREDHYSSRDRHSDSSRSSKHHDPYYSSSSSRHDRDRDRDRHHSEYRSGSERSHTSRRDGGGEYDRQRGYDTERHSRSTYPDEQPDRSRLAPGHYPSAAPPAAAPSPSHPSSGANSPLPSAGADSSKTAEELEKQRIKKEKLEAWKAKKAKDAANGLVTGTPPPVSAQPTPPATSPAKLQPQTVAHSLPPKPLAVNPTEAALAAAAAISSRLGSSGGVANKLNGSLPAKPSFSFNSTALRPSGLKNSLSLGEEVEEKKIGMIKFDEGEVDMNMPDADEDEGDDEDLDGDVVFKPRGDAQRDPRALAFLAEESNGDDDAMAVDTKVEEEVEDEDELDAFMAGVNSQVKTVDKQDRAKLAGKAATNGAVGDGDDDDDDDEQAVSEDESEKVALTAHDILALAAKKARRGRELQPVDHSKVAYEPFRKAFYHPPREVEELTAEEVDQLRLEMDEIKVRGAEPPKPAAKWSYCGLPSTCIDVIRALEYARPTAIQSQAIPAIMSGRDMIGVAKTGSGKTMAFILPMFRHIKDQRPLKTMEGPIAMIMTPTRELATQIFKECRPFLKALGLRASCAYGGTPLKDNIAEMKRGSEVIVCTPGRMIELLTTNSGRIINLQRITYLVLDEADRMFDMGFEPQVMKIINQVRPDRQTVLFSATFPKQMEALARKILRRPLEITVGGRSVVAAEITQIVEVREEDSKFNRLLELLGNLFNSDDDARALIFVERQESADKLLTDLLRKNYSCMSLHGGMEQVDRDQTIIDFKNGLVPVVIATSVAARGLDVKALKLVVQYDAPNHMEDYVHRAGRTGRAGNKGTCVTFITKDQDRYALDIFKALQASNAPIPDDVRALAEAFAEKVKAGKASGAGSGFGGKGLERFEEDRDAASRAERAAYGEAAESKKDESTAEGGPGETQADAIDAVQDMEVEIKRGPAPDTSKPLQAARSGGTMLAPGKGKQLDEPAIEALAKAAADAAEAQALGEGKPEGVAKARGMVAALNAKAKARKEAQQQVASTLDTSTDSARRRDPDATDFHAIIYINDYPQKARWKVTNKDTMSQMVESTGASITNKGNYYEPGKEPGPGELPKLHLLIESNDESRVQHAIAEVKRALIEGAVLAVEAENRHPGQTNPSGRYQIA